MSDSSWLACWDGETSPLLELVSSISAKGQGDLVWLSIQLHRQRNTKCKSDQKVFCQDTPAQLCNEFAWTDQAGPQCLFQAEAHWRCWKGSGCLQRALRQDLSVQRHFSNTQEGPRELPDCCSKQTTCALRSSTQASPLGVCWSPCAAAQLHSPH